MVLHVEKTLKTTIKKKLRKSHNFAKKKYVAEFPYSQITFLRFTVTLFHNNLDEKKITSNEQKVTSNEQNVTSNKHKVTGNGQKVTSNEQQAKSSAS